MSYYPFGMKKYLYLLSLRLVYLLMLPACSLHHTETPSSIVPPTADQDPALPQLRIRVAGRVRVIHLQTFGDPQNPVAFVLPGGPGEDFRLLLPLQALSDRYFIVMWDQRGAGLSERVPEEELYLESFNEEIAQVREALAPGRLVTLIGHSYGGQLAARYASAYPEAVDQLILIEPGPLNQYAREHYPTEIVRFRDGQDFFWQNQVLTSQDHASADYKAVALMREASRQFTCGGEIPPEYPFWRFGAYYYYIIKKIREPPGKSLNWASGIEELSSEIILMAGTCGVASEHFQRNYNLQALPHTRLVTIRCRSHQPVYRLPDANYSGT